MTKEHRITFTFGYTESTVICAKESINYKSVTAGNPYNT